MKTVTFDSTTRPEDPEVLAAQAEGWDVAFVSVSLREAKGADFEEALRNQVRVPEIALWDESRWDEARWADELGRIRLEQILEVISNGGFPRDRSNLTKGQLHQLRDALILEAHSAAGRAVFVTGDLKGFIKNDRREQLEDLLKTRILTAAEFRAELIEDSRG